MNKNVFITFSYIPLFNQTKMASSSISLQGENQSGAEYASKAHAVPPLRVKDQGSTMDRRGLAKKKIASNK